MKKAAIGKQTKRGLQHGIVSYKSKKIFSSSEPRDKLERR